MLKEDINTGDDLIDAVKDALERKGVMKDIKAKVRAAVFHTLEDKTIRAEEVDKPQDIFLASELIRDYLATLQHNNSLSVFVEESGQPDEMGLDRQFIGEELGFNIDDQKVAVNKDGKASFGKGDLLQKQVPLLVLLIQQLRRNKNERDSALYSSMMVEEDLDQSNY
jgi:lisH domain-containing protein FOPNL